MTAANLARTAAKMVNGVNVAALYEAAEAIRAKPETAKLTFRARNTWMGGDRNQTIIKEFSGALEEHRTGVQAFIAENGQPEVLFGDDAAPSPVEWLLHALVGCLTTTIVYHATPRGIVIEAIESDIDGDLDVRGFLGLSQEIPKGLSAIRVHMRVKTDALAETLKGLAQLSPIHDLVSRAVPVSLSIKTY